MKTAIQELIDSFENFKGMCTTDGEKFIINYVINNSKLRLEIEKTQLNHAFEQGKQIQESKQMAWKGNHQFDASFDGYYSERYVEAEL